MIFADNDYEIFINPDGSTHNYKEFEMNARAAWWDLALKAPYENGGYENSSRKGAQACCWDDPKARVVRRCVSLPAAPPPFFWISIFTSISVSRYSCCSSCHDKQLNHCSAQNASVVGCTLNKPLSGPCEGWIAEIAFPLAAISLNNSNTLPPPEGSYWRINFSRVEWKVRRRKPNASPLHCHFVVKHNNLSRQARDKHMETLKKRGRSPCGAPGPRGRRSLPAGRPSELQLAIAARLRPSKQRRQLGVGGARKSSRVMLSTRQCSPVQFSSVQFSSAAGIALHCCACARQTE